MYLAVPLSRPGGQIGIITFGKTGRQPNKLPAVVNGAEVLDSAFDPFDPSVIAAGRIGREASPRGEERRQRRCEPAVARASCVVGARTACEDGAVRIWRIPEGGLTKDIDEPALKISAHSQRINIVAFHPLAKDVLITTAAEYPESTIKYWNAATGELLQTITGFKDLVFGFAHSFDGARLAVASKDGRLRVFDARSGALLQEGPSHEGSRGARVLWLGDTNRLLTVGWNK